HRSLRWQRRRAWKKLFGPSWTSGNSNTCLFRAGGVSPRGFAHQFGVSKKESAMREVALGADPGLGEHQSLRFVLFASHCVMSQDRSLKVRTKTSTKRAKLASTSSGSPKPPVISRSTKPCSAL